MLKFIKSLFGIKERRCVISTAPGIVTVFNASESDVALFKRTWGHSPDFSVRPMTFDEIAHEEIREAKRSKWLWRY